MRAASHNSPQVISVSWSQTQWEHRIIFTGSVGFPQESRPRLVESPPCRVLRTERSFHRLWSAMTCHHLLVRRLGAARRATFPTSKGFPWNPRAKQK